MLDPDSSLQVRAPRIGDIRVIRARVLLAQRRARYLSMPLSESGVYIPHRSLPFYVQDGPLLYASAATVPRGNPKAALFCSHRRESGCRTAAIGPSQSDGLQRSGGDGG